MRSHLAAITRSSSLPAADPAVAEATAMGVRKSDGYGCCLSWMTHLAENGVSPTGVDLFGEPFVPRRHNNAVPQRAASIHTSIVGV